MSMFVGVRCSSCGENPNSYTGLGYDMRSDRFNRCPACGASGSLVDQYLEPEDFGDSEDRLVSEGSQEEGGASENPHKVDWDNFDYPEDVTDDSPF